MGLAVPTEYSIICETGEQIAMTVLNSVWPKAPRPITKPPLFRRNRLTGRGNPTFESCVEVKAQQR